MTTPREFWLYEPSEKASRRCYPYVRPVTAVGIPKPSTNPWLRKTPFIVIEKKPVFDKIEAARAIVLEALDDQKGYGCDCGADDAPNIGHKEVVCHYHQILEALK